MTIFKKITLISFRLESKENLEEYSMKKRTKRSIENIDDKTQLCQQILTLVEYDDFLNEKSSNVNAARQSESKFDLG